VSGDYNMPDLLPETANGQLGPEQLVECLLFVADGPVAVAQLAQALELTPRDVEAALAALETVYAGRGLRLQRWQDRVQLTTAPAAAAHIERFLGLAATTRLSHAALETLAIVAYQQPVTRPQIEAVRGVNSDSVLKSLLGKGLVEEVGRSEGVGRPILYRTTPEFLQHFGLSSLTELPPLNLPEALAEAERADGASEPPDASEAPTDTMPEAVEAEAPPPAQPETQAEAALERPSEGATEAPPEVMGVEPPAEAHPEPPEVSQAQAQPEGESGEASPPAPKPPQKPASWQGDWAPVEEAGEDDASVPQESEADTPAL
jgi:segregation and condensation protein B